MATLNTKLSLLDASNTETVEARLNAVLQKMQQIAEKKEKEPQVDPDKQKKVRIFVCVVYIRIWMAL